MVDGFNSLHREMNNLKNEFVSHREVCFVRFGVMEENFKRSLGFVLSDEGK